MIRKLYISFALYIVFLITTATMCHCGPFPDGLEVTDISVSVCELDYSTPGNYAGCQDIADTVAYERFAINLIPETRAYYSARYLQGNMSAYACSAPMPVITDKIDSMYVFSNRDFDTRHPAGADLKDLFDAIVFSSSDTRGDYRLALTEFLADKPVFPDNLYLVLTSPPDSTAGFSFTIKLFTEGQENRSFEIITDTVVIKN